MPAHTVPNGYVAREFYMKGNIREEGFVIPDQIYYTPAIGVTVTININKNDGRPTRKTLVPVKYEDKVLAYLGDYHGALYAKNPEYDDVAVPATDPDTGEEIPGSNKMAQYVKVINDGA